MWGSRLLTAIPASTAVTRIALIRYIEKMFVSHRKHILDTTACYGDSFTLVYVDVVRISQEAWTTTVRYLNSFTLQNVDDVRTS
jgi:hypothetical protein